MGQPLFRRGQRTLVLSLTRHLERAMEALETKGWVILVTWSPQTLERAISGQVTAGCHLRIQ